SVIVDKGNYFAGGRADRAISGITKAAFRLHQVTHLGKAGNGLESTIVRWIVANNQELEIETKPVQSEKSLEPARQRIGTIVRAHGNCDSLDAGKRRIRIGGLSGGQVINREILKQDIAVLPRLTHRKPYWNSIVSE